MKPLKWAGNMVNSAESKAFNGAVNMMKSPVYGPISNAKSINGNRERIENLYTGKKLNPAWVGGIGGTYLAGTNMRKSMQKEMMPMKFAGLNPIQYGAPDIMMADGVSQTPARRNMNADGSLVFGLHNMRKG